MEYYPLEVTIISAGGLKNVNMFSKMDVYAVVKILGYPSKNNTKKTNVDKNSGSNPKWNFHLRFDVAENSLNNPGISLLVQLKSDRTFGSAKDIGEVNVPIPELYNGFSKEKDSSDKVVEYQVRTSSGKPKGTLKFSYKFGDKFTQAHVDEGKTKNPAGEPMTAYPAAAGASTAYPQYPQMGYAMPPPGYQQPPPHGGYGAPPTPGYGGYPPAAYPPQGPPPPGYGYPPPPGYGYPMQQPVQPPKKNKGKSGMGLGIGMGLLGGLLVGDMIGDVGEMAAYDAGYDDAMGF
ncbi:OLC1v1000400C1 [Oldenlandia corymbosa var. corymbosa]|uniref:OLC1v1000400C1 n=1 Tax=Oldenlandia corymbosa var. corymbosa TaxID=529605 RepID=A0AAV1D2N1_OLDCO|nr:OLC1v1000400C1 [Oldenlandia corymbosa var. corymbosa]